MPTLGPDDFPDYRSRAPWLGPDLQTLRNLLRGPVLSQAGTVRSVRLELPLADGSGDRLSARLERPPSGGEGPLVVLIHGLGGSEESAYLHASAAALLAAGRRVLRLNLRGAGPSRPLCAQQYHAGRTRDLHDALAALPPGLLEEGVVLVGFSLGGNMLLKFLSEIDADGVVRAAVSVSAPIDLAAASRRFLEPRNLVYHRYLLRGMQEEALGEGAALTEEERRVIPEVRSILEFDERIVAPRNGYAGAADYYAKNHARQFLAAIPVTTLVIHALDDPWIPGEAYTSFDWSGNPKLVPLLPAGGGHVGFHGAGTRLPWHDRCIARLLERI